MHNDVIEQIQFRGRDAAADARMAEAAWAAQPDLERLPGFVSRHFGRSEDSGWIDVVRWSSMDAARAAADTAGRIPAVAAFFALIDMATVDMRHSTAPAPAALWSRNPPVRGASTTLVLQDYQATRAFYEQHFNARALFDAPGYVLLQLGGPLAPQLALMNPMDDSGQACFGGGTVLNLQVDDVDALCARLLAGGVALTMPLADHAWGDRGFAVQDPAGLKVYCYSPIAASAPFDSAFREPWRLDSPAETEIEQTIHA